MTTQAGKRLLGDIWISRTFEADPEDMIAAIEAEAVVAERVRIAAAVRGRKIPQADPDYLTHYGHGYNDAIAAVLAIVEEP